MNAKIAGITRARAVRNLLEQYEVEADAVDQMRALAGVTGKPGDAGDSGYAFDIEVNDVVYVVSAEELSQVFQQRMTRIAKELEGYGINVSAEDPTPVGIAASPMSAEGERP